VCLSHKFASLVLQEIEKAGGKAKAIELDVSGDQAAIKKSVDEAWAAFGKLDILVSACAWHILSSVVLLTKVLRH
jgi:NAD(P)-dependent dehydrogenase (short-subunit alcohol dehydrogenase family)